MDGVIKNADLIKGFVGDNLRNSLSELQRNVALVSLKEDVDLNLNFEDLLKLNPNQEELDKISNKIKILENLAETTNKEIEQIIMLFKLKTLTNRESFHKI